MSGEWKAEISHFKELLERIETRMTDRSLLKKFGLQKREMQKLLHKKSFRAGIQNFADKKIYSCEEILAASRTILGTLSPEPEGGWLPFLFADGKHVLYPENFPDVMEPCYEEGKIFLMELLRVCFTAERDFYGLRMTLHFSLATEEEQAGSPMQTEYKQFLAFCRDTYFLEFMRLAAEVTPFNTHGHIAGVHNVAMHMARQMKEAGQPIDLALMSGAAIGHDIGKFGCKDKESRRVPYLHYYYTDQLFMRNNMPVTGYIAANHSTWDLELENLSIESLLLIYADFRVKSTRENGAEKIHCYTLTDSFHVILSKLDNVDDAKRRRYEKVYRKLKDFEDYMIRLGAHTDLVEQELTPEPAKDSALLQGHEIIDAYKTTAISHNIRLMNLLNHEDSFTNILEAARSEKDWKNTRTYLNIFREYSTYLSQRQKQTTLRFLYELLMHQESDIRAAAARLMGRILVDYDIEYRKEIPEGMLAFSQLSSSFELYDQYLETMLNPDHRLTDQHREWLGYKMETLSHSLLTHCKESKRDGYYQVLGSKYRNTLRDSFTAFIMVITLQRIPLSACPRDILDDMVQFLLHFSKTPDLELQVGILNALEKMLGEKNVSEAALPYARQIMEQVDCPMLTSTMYLKQLIAGKLHFSSDYIKPFLFEDDNDHRVNEAFLENLRAATPWICKMINIRYLYESMKAGRNHHPLHTMTHLVNLLTGTECGDVRHLAGTTLVSMMDLTEIEQRSEVAIELLKGLELSDAEYAKNVPQYLGRIIVKLLPENVDEIMESLHTLLISAPDPVASVALDTVGTLIQHYDAYKKRYPDENHHDQRMRKLLGMILRGIAHYHSTVSEEACYVMGEYIFRQNVMPLTEKWRIFRYLSKKAIHILSDNTEEMLDFLINAAALNSVYRFLSEYTPDPEDVTFVNEYKAAFFPGTFDPFSLSHKGIVEEIRKLGYPVYLAIDEFSWSKKTQPPAIRRKIAMMSVAANPGVFLFPKDVPINLANPEDLAVLKDMMSGKELYIVAGSDVTANASAYQKEEEPNSIHHFHHIIFRRHGDDYEVGTSESGDSPRILGKVVELSLPIQLEDISSTRIRENIDMNRDISNLIDTMAQNYIYENNLYTREPQYKGVHYTRSINCDIMSDSEISDELWEELLDTVLRAKKNPDIIRKNLQDEKLQLAILRDMKDGGRPIAAAVAGRLMNADFMKEFRDLEMVKKLRDKAWGKIMVIKGVYGPKMTPDNDPVQIVISELIAYALSREYTYCLYHGRKEMEEHRENVEFTLKRSGFIYMSEPNAENTVMAVDMHRPITLTKNIETVIKAPLNTNPRVHEMIEEAHRRLQTVLTEINPGNLVLSFDSSIMYHRMVQKIAELNNVPNVVTRPRKLGAKMCVPFGKVLRGSVTPNTVTKALHTEKVFNANMHGFQIEEYPNYWPIKTQLDTIRSFRRNVILVDDLLHKGYRLKELYPMLPGSGITIDKILLGVMTANGKDLVEQYGFESECVYYIPHISSWFVESSLYPFIGGDSVRSNAKVTAGLLTSVNLIMPYVTPAFLAHENISAVYDLSMTCLKNARDIMKVLEEEYRKEFERNLTLDRLTEVILSPTCPDKGRFMRYDVNIPASFYIDNDIQQLSRLEYMRSMELGFGDYYALHSD